jgi:RNA polymerase sigma-70 factor (ECF subfamily)
MAKRGRNRRPASNKVVPLLRAARRGSATALGQVLNAYRPFLLAIATAELDTDLKAKAGPSDVVQETFLDAQRDFARFKSDNEAELRIWLHAILMNNLADFRKRYLATAKRQVRRERPLTASDSKQLLRELAAAEGHSPSRAAISREEQARLSAALDRLRPADRQVIVLRSKERRSFKDIGALIGKTPDAARMLWRRAILNLRRELGEGDEPA